MSEKQDLDNNIAKIGSEKVGCSSNTKPRLSADCAV